MSRRKPPEPQNAEGFIMTPMIDVTFQILIFFMLVNDMATRSVVKLTLPSADQAIKEEATDEDLVVVNVMDDGRIKINGKTFYDPNRNATDHSLIEHFFKNRRNMQKYWDRPGGQTVKYPVLIRADACTEFMHVQKMMMLASMHGGVYKVQLGAKLREFAKKLD